MSSTTYCRLCNNYNHSTKNCSATTTLYHGTKVSNVTSICRNGLNASSSGRIGPGVYFAGSKDIAKKIASYRGSGTGTCVVICKVNLGKLKYSYDSQNKYENVKDKDGSWNKSYDSCRAEHPSWKSAGIYSSFTEWCVSDKNRCCVIGLELVDGTVDGEIYLPGGDISVSGTCRFKGSVTAGNSSQMSDGAAFVLVMSEKMVEELKIKPIARLVSYAAAGVEPRLMGIGPVKAVPKALKQAGIKLQELDLIELNEAFASQSLAVINELQLDTTIVNVNGGAIALGHPLGCTGAKLSVQLFDEMRQRKMHGKYGAVTMCVGTGQGACGIFEFLN